MNSQNSAGVRTLYFDGVLLWVSSTTVALLMLKQWRASSVVTIGALTVTDSSVVFRTRLVFLPLV